MEALYVLSVGAYINSYISEPVAKYLRFVFQPRHRIVYRSFELGQTRSLLFHTILGRYTNVAFFVNGGLFIECD